MRFQFTEIILDVRFTSTLAQVDSFKGTWDQLRCRLGRRLYGPVDCVTERWLMKGRKAGEPAMVKG